MRQNVGLDGGDGGYGDRPQNNTSHHFFKNGREVISRTVFGSRIRCISAGFTNVRLDYRGHRKLQCPVYGCWSTYGIRRSTFLHHHLSETSLLLQTTSTWRTGSTGNTMTEETSPVSHLSLLLGQTPKGTNKALSKCVIQNVSYHFYLPPVFENGGRYCFGVRRRLRRLRRLRRCFALYLACY